VSTKDKQRIGAIVLITASFGTGALSAWLNEPALLLVCVYCGLFGGFFLRQGTRP
jgi:hypothetical protein